MKLNKSSDAAACKLLVRLLCSLFICKSLRAAGCMKIGTESSISKLKFTALLQTDLVLSGAWMPMSLECKSILHNGHMML